MHHHEKVKYSSEDNSVQKLLVYWDKLRGDRLFPRENEIEQDDIEDIWQSCFLISIDDVTRRLGYRYSYLGEDLVKFFGDEDDNPDAALRLLSVGNISIKQKIEEVLTGQKPVFDESEFINLKRQKIKYLACMLPLGFESGEVSHILGCISGQEEY